MSELQIKLPKWYDLHMHARQGPAVEIYLKAHHDMGCCGILAMPNTQPPVARVLGENSTEYWTIQSYTSLLMQNGANAFENVIVPLYLTPETTSAMIEEGYESGLLKAVKYYPPHGTTNSEHGLPMEKLIGSDVLKTMEATGTILCIHGEQHGMASEGYFSRSTNAEEKFYREMMPRLLEAHPSLKIVCEHITTKAAVDFVKQTDGNVAASVTPQHMLYTVGHLLQGLRYHLYCMPLVKFPDDRNALREAVISGSNKFFAGTDSAPHTNKQTPCGCAAGCFTGGVAPQLYAQAFEEAGADMANGLNQHAFAQFLSVNGPKFYGLEVSEDTFTLVKRSQAVEVLQTPAGAVTPLPVGMNPNHENEDTTIPWSVEL